MRIFGHSDLRKSLCVVSVSVPVTGKPIWLWHPVMRLSIRSLRVETRCPCKYRLCFLVLSIRMRSCLPLIPMSADIRSILILILFCGRHSDCFPNAKRLFVWLIIVFWVTRDWRIFRRNGKSFRKIIPIMTWRYITHKIRQPAILFLLFAIRVIVTDVW